MTLLMAMTGLTFASFSTGDDDEKTPNVPSKSIVILFEGDTHCEVDGYSRFAGLRDAMREADTAHVVTVSFYNLLKDCPVLRATTLMVRDVVIDYMTKTLGGSLGETYRWPQGRITIVD